MEERSCDTCAHKAAETADENGKRMVDCDINGFQMYSPFAEECKRWERAVAED